MIYKLEKHKLFIYSPKSNFVEQIQMLKKLKIVPVNFPDIRQMYLR